MTVEHLRPLLENQRDAERLWMMGQELANASVPDEIIQIQALRVGRLTPLLKPSGGVRTSFVVWLPARLPPVETATAPFQYALSTCVGTEYVYHVLQALTDNDERATILSVDGIGAFDLISRESMMRGLLEVEGGGKVLPFVRQFYGSFSTHLWEDEEGTVQFISFHPSRWEQGDPHACTVLLGSAQSIGSSAESLGPHRKVVRFP